MFEGQGYMSRVQGHKRKMLLKWSVKALMELSSC